MPATLTPRPTPAAAATPQVAVYLGATLIDARQVRYQAKANDLGSFEFSMLNTDADTETIVFGTKILIELGGVDDFVGIVTDIVPSTIAQGEEAAQSTTFSGVSILGELAWGMVRPSSPFRTWGSGTPLDGLELGNYPFADTRYLNWASPGVDRTAWASATQLFQVSQFPPLDPPLGLYGAPEAWPHPSSYWIAPRATSGGAHPVGTWYAYKTFTSDAQTFDVDIWAACAPDDNYELWLDGQPVIVSDRNEQRETKPVRARVGVTSGSHTLVAKITHGYASSGDITGFVCSVHKHKATDLRGPAGYTLAPLTYTSSAWKVLDFGADTPGYNMGEAGLALLGEMQARGVCTTWSAGFSTSVDSSGAAWGDPVELPTPNGKSLFECLLQWAESFVDFDYDIDTNGGRQLNMWIKGNRTSSSGVSLLAGSVLNLDHHGTDDVRNDLIVRWDGGLARFQDADSVAEHGRREAYLSVPEITDGRSAFWAALSALAYMATATESVEVEHLWTSDRSYRVGETVTTMNRENASVSLEVKAMTVSADEDGQATVTAEMNVARDDLQARADRYTRSVAHGTLDGRSEIAVPINSSIISSQQISPVNKQMSTGGGTTIAGDRPSTSRFDEPTLVTRLEFDCTVAGASGSTTVRVERDGTTVGTVTAASGSRTGSTTLSPPVIFTRANYIGGETTVAGGHEGVNVTLIGIPLQ